MPKNAAAIICPLNSNTLILIKALAHNLFHKICEEAWDRTALPAALGKARRGSRRGGPSAEPVFRQASDYTSLDPALPRAQAGLAVTSLPKFWAGSAFPFEFRDLRSGR